MRWQEGGRRGEEEEDKEREGRDIANCAQQPCYTVHALVMPNPRNDIQSARKKQNHKQTLENTTRRNRPPGCRTDQLFPVSMHVKNVNRIWKNEDLRDIE